MSYGQFLYGVAGYASDSEDEQIVVEPVDLLAYLPDYYREIREFRELMATEGEELGGAWLDSESLLDQYFVLTATWGLDLWEAELGMLTDATKPAARRREQIKAKLRGIGVTTRQMLIDTAAAFSGGEVDVIEYPGEHRFVVKFIGVLGIPPNLAGFIQMVDRIKPAHLAYSLEYTYTAWNMLQGLTWSGAATRTWSQLRTYGGT